MNKKNTIVLVFAMLGFSHLSAQNVGIGIATPLAKTHINQTAAVDGILVDHAGGAGNSLELVPTNAGNASSTVWIRNGTSGAGINNQLLNAASTASSIISNNTGLGLGLDVLQSNTGATGAGLQIDQDGTGVFSRGVDMYLDAANISEGYTLFHEGTGAGFYMDLINATNASTGYDLRHKGTGRGTYVELSNAASTAVGSAVYHLGQGAASELGVANATNTSMVSSIYHDGVGRGQQILLRNAANLDMGIGVFHDGDGTGQYISMRNAAATRNSLGLIVNYNGTGGGTGGGGNAIEVQHYGNNGNGVDLFMGDPASPAGPGNTTSEYTALSVSHMATGTSPTVGLVKCAISATNNSADPTVLVNNSGTEDGDGMQVFVTPVVAATQATGVFAQSADASGGEGIGVFGFGGDFGVVGSTNGGNNLGLFSATDFAANGTKAFLIDHPLDPANKSLRHFCIESDEVLNMYRGIATLDASGQAIIELPTYFDALNINPSYQLTAIGTATQPYVLAEIVNNKFTVAGAPNTKVSWTIHAQRNDPTLQYYASKIPEYTTAVRMKRPHEVGKYYTPEAYGKAATEGVLYNIGRAKNHAEQKAFMEQQKAMTSERFQKETTIQRTEMPAKKAVVLSKNKGEKLVTN